MQTDVGELWKLMKILGSGAGFVPGDSSTDSHGRKCSFREVVIVMVIDRQIHPGL